MQDIARPGFIRQSSASGTLALAKVAGATADKAVAIPINRQFALSYYLVMAFLCQLVSHFSCLVSA